MRKHPYCSLQPLQIRNEKARRYLSCMRKKQPVPFTQKFRNADPLALRLLERLLAFDPKDRPTAEEVNSEHRFLSFVGTALTISTKMSHIYFNTIYCFDLSNLISGSG